MAHVKGFKVVVKSDNFMGEYQAVHGMLPRNELPKRMKRIPKRQIWIRRSNYENHDREVDYSKDNILRHERHELNLMLQGIPYRDAHEAAIAKYRPHLPIVKERNRFLNTLTNNFVSDQTAAKINRYFMRHPKATMYQAYHRPIYNKDVKWADQPKAIQKLYRKKVQLVKTKDAEGRTVYFAPLTNKMVDREKAEKLLSYDFTEGRFKVSLYRLTAAKDRVYHTISFFVGKTVTDPGELDALFDALEKEWLPPAMELTKRIAKKYPLGKVMRMYARFRHTMYFTQYHHSMDGAVTIMINKKPVEDINLMPAEFRRAKHEYHKLLHTYHTVTIHDIKVYMRSWASRYTTSIAEKRLGVFKRNGD